MSEHESDLDRVAKDLYSVALMTFRQTVQRTEASDDPLEIAALWKEQAGWLRRALEALPEGYPTVRECLIACLERAQQLYELHA
jgi:hypothetical protein